MIGFTWRRNVLKTMKASSQLMKYNTRAMSTFETRYIDAKRVGDRYHFMIPFVGKENIQVNLGVHDSLLDLANAISKSDKNSSLDFLTMDGSSLPKSSLTKLFDFRNMPIMLSINNSFQYIINFSQKFSINKEFSLDQLEEPNEEAFQNFWKSVGIPNKDSEVLSAFLYRMYESIPTHVISNEDLKATMFHALSSFRSFADNQWGTNRVSVLKNILEAKEKELQQMREVKRSLDKKALRRANLMLYMGGTIVLGQFSFIVGGTYLYFCWDVMEPMAYLMLTSNLTAAFAYYWWRHTELDYEPLQGRFKSRIAEGIYKRKGFDYPKYEALKEEVNQIRDLINQSL